MAASILVLVVVAALGYVAKRRSEDAESMGDPGGHGFTFSERREFHVLEGSTRPLPLGLTNRLRLARDGEVSRLWFDTARYLATGAGYWIVNGPDAVCIVEDRDGAVACEPQATLLRRGVSLGVVHLGPPPAQKAREFVVAGLVPNRVDAVKVKVGGRTWVIPALGNAYSLSAGSPVTVEGFIGN
jgi:hypothetical protein